jgi:hypothetical protein
MKTSGEWTGFGVRGERSLIERGGVVCTRAIPATRARRARVIHARGHARDETTSEASLRRHARWRAIHRSSLTTTMTAAWMRMRDKVDNDNDGQTDEDLPRSATKCSYRSSHARGSRITVHQRATRGRFRTSMAWWQRRWS